MLVITRKQDESLMIGTGIEIKIIKIDGNKVRVGIEAPQGVQVLRRELFLEIQEEMLEANNSAIKVSIMDSVKALFDEK